MILAEVGKGRVPGKDGGAREGPEGMGWLAGMEGTSLDGDPNCHGRMASLGGDQKGQVGDKQGDWRGLRADSERRQGEAGKGGCLAGAGKGGGPRRWERTGCPAGDQRGWSVHQGLGKVG